MFSRNISQNCLDLAKKYPVVTVTGPRQSGKTTLVRELFKDYPYVNLEDPELRAIAKSDPKALFNKYPERLIIDEIQHVPELLSYIQVIVDEKQLDGMFILTGSQQLALHQALAQSLSGRTTLLQLMPLALQELAQGGVTLSLNEQLLQGFYPRIYSKNLNSTQYYRDYVKTYLERDVRHMINLKDLLVFQKFLKLCAGRTGCELNVNNLANEVGVSNHTIKHWLSILQASYIIILLAPYFENFGKQVIKAPKLYFTDVGLACYLLEIETVVQVSRDPLRGHLFETLVVMDLVKTRCNQAREPNLYFYRDSQKNEIDIIYKRGSALIPIEIKSAQTLDFSFFKGINYFRQLVGSRCTEAHIVYAGDTEITLEQGSVHHYQHAYQIVAGIDEEEMN